MAKTTIANNPELLGLVDLKPNIVFSTARSPRTRRTCSSRWAAEAWKRIRRR